MSSFERFFDFALMIFLAPIFFRKNLKNSNFSKNKKRIELE